MNSIKNCSKESWYRKNRLNRTETVALKGQTIEISTHPFSVEDALSASDEISEANKAFLETLSFEKHTINFIGGWCFTRLTIRYPDNKPYMAVLHNYHSMYAANFFEFKDVLYLFCQEDYQGFSILNLAKLTEQHFISKDAHKGWGFCISDVGSVEIEEDGIHIKGEGCYWGAEYDNFEFVVKDPDNIEEVQFETTDKPYVEEKEEEENA